MIAKHENYGVRNQGTFDLWWALVCRMNPDKTEVEIANRILRGERLAHSRAVERLEVA